MQYLPRLLQYLPRLLLHPTGAIAPTYLSCDVRESQTTDSTQISSVHLSFRLLTIFYGLTRNSLTVTVNHDSQQCSRQHQCWHSKVYMANVLHTVFMNSDSDFHKAKISHFFLPYFQTAQTCIWRCILPLESGKHAIFCGIVAKGIAFFVLFRQEKKQGPAKECTCLFIIIAKRQTSDDMSVLERDHRCQHDTDDLLVLTFVVHFSFLATGQTTHLPRGIMNMQALHDT